MHNLQNSLGHFVEVLVLTVLFSTSCLGDDVVPADNSMDPNYDNLTNYLGGIDSIIIFASSVEGWRQGPTWQGVSRLTLRWNPYDYLIESVDPIRADSIQSSYPMVAAGTFIFSEKEVIEEQLPSERFASEGVGSNSISSDLVHLILVSKPRRGVEEKTIWFQHFDRDSKLLRTILVAEDRTSRSMTIGNWTENSSAAIFGVNETLFVFSRIHDSVIQLNEAGRPIRASNGDRFICYESSSQKFRIYDAVGTLTNTCVNTEIENPRDAYWLSKRFIMLKGSVYPDGYGIAHSISGYATYVLDIETGLAAPIGKSLSGTIVYEVYGHRKE